MSFVSSVEANGLERGEPPAVMGQMTLCHFDEKRQRPLVMDVWYTPASLGPMHSDKNWVEPNVVLQALLKDPQAKHPLIPILKNKVNDLRRDFRGKTELGDRS